MGESLFSLFAPPLLSSVYINPCPPTHSAITTSSGKSTSKQLTMATISTILPLCLSLLLFFQASVAQLPLGSPLQSSRGFRGDQASLRQCRFEKLAALEPTHQVRSEAGFTEYYNAEARNEFLCAGLHVRRLVVESAGLVLPKYANGPKLVYIVQGLYYIQVVTTFYSLPSQVDVVLECAQLTFKFFDRYRLEKLFRSITRKRYEYICHRKYFDIIIFLLFF